MIGLHGTSLWAARRILRGGWDVAAAGVLATPRMRTGPELVYATWLDDTEPERALWTAREWAVEASERAVITPQGQRLAGAVLALEVAADALVMPYAERVAPAAAVRVLGVVSVGRGQVCRCVACEAVGLPVRETTWRWRMR